MLKAVTKKYHDLSTERYFMFEFYCDRCGKAWQSEPYYFEHNFRDDATVAEEKAKEIMWRVEHDAAFERANLEAMLKLDHCEICGRTVCDECFSLNELCDTCVDCDKIREGKKGRAKK